MRALIQRVRQATIDVDGVPSGGIDQGLVVLVGVGRESGQQDADWLAEKILKLRLFENNASSEGGGFSVNEIKGGLLVVSQFTLHASTKKGTRPSYHRAAPPEMAEPLYDYFVRRLKELHRGEIQTGKFGAHMDIHLTNDGPITLMLDAEHRE